MNLLLLEADEIAASSECVVTGRRAEHLLEVLRVEPGNTVRAGVINGQLGTATVVDIRDSAAKVEDGSREISTGNQDLNVRTQQQAAAHPWGTPPVWQYGATDNSNGACLQAHTPQRGSPAARR